MKPLDRSSNPIAYRSIISPPRYIPVPKTANMIPISLSTLYNARNASQSFEFVTVLPLFESLSV